MDHNEAMQFLKNLSKSGSIYGLSRMRHLMYYLGEPQSKLKFIHVAGTNGKGSVCAFLSQILSQCGYHTGCYFSPAPFGYREHFQINGIPISRDMLAAQVTRIVDAIESMKRIGQELPTLFEVETALAFSYFADMNCDFVVLETGMGGKEDATNIIATTMLEIFTPIAMDHTAVLGDTLSQIAEQKAGIFKYGVPAVSAVQAPEAEQVLKNTAFAKRCVLHFVDPCLFSDISYGLTQQTFSYGIWKDVKISMGGTYQVENAALALEAVVTLRSIGLDLPKDSVCKALALTKWQGRFTVLANQPLILLDGAHNPNGAKALARSIKQLCREKSCYMIFGMLQDKDYLQVSEILAPLATRIFTIQTPHNPRALSATVLADTVQKTNPSVEAVGTIPAAVERAISLASEEDLVLICGSLSFLEDARFAVYRALEQKGACHEPN